jgi:hypothetical protein
MKRPRNSKTEAMTLRNTGHDSETQGMTLRNAGHGLETQAMILRNTGHDIQKPRPWHSETQARQKHRA